MSATNKTTNLELPIYIGSDKPTYLGDWNSAMEKIDNFSGRTSTAITEVKNVAQGAVESVGHMQSEVTEVSSTLDLLNGRISALETNDASQDTKITKLNNDIADLQSTGMDTESRLTALESQSDLNTGNITTLQTNVSSLQTSQTAILNAITTLDEKTDGLDTRVTALEESGTGGEFYFPTIDRIYMLDGNDHNYFLLGQTLNDAYITSTATDLGSLALHLPPIYGKGSPDSFLTTAELNSLLQSLEVDILSVELLYNFYVATMSKNFHSFGCYFDNIIRNKAYFGEIIAEGLKESMINGTASTKTITLTTGSPSASRVAIDSSHDVSATGAGMAMAFFNYNYNPQLELTFTPSAMASKYVTNVSARLVTSVNGTLHIPGIGGAMSATMAEVKIKVDLMASLDYGSVYSKLIQ